MKTKITSEGQAIWVFQETTREIRKKNLFSKRPRKHTRKRAMITPAARMLDLSGETYKTPKAVFFHLNPPTHTSF